MFLSIYKTDEKANYLRNKIFINGICLTDIETKEDIPIDETTKLPYNTIIKAEDNSKWIDKFIKEFNDTELNSKFFYKTSEDIHTTADLLKATNEFTDLNQYVFAIYYAKENDNNYLTYFKNPFTKVDLVNHFYTNNCSNKLLKGYLKLWSENYIYPSSFALQEVENLPDDFELWHKEDRNKIIYLSKLGVYIENSNVVQLRKHFKNPTLDFDISIIPKIDVLLLENTLKWLEAESIVITQPTYNAVKSIYNVVQENKSDTPVLIYNSVDNEIYTYKLKSSLNNPVYGFEELNGKHKAFELLNDCDIVCGIHKNWLTNIGKIIETTQKPDIEKLKTTQKQEADFQNEWTEETGFELYFYNGQIPYLDYIVGYETEPISVSEKTCAIDIVGEKIYIDREQQNNLKTLLAKVIDNKQIERYFLWQKAFRLLQYLKQENPQNEIDFVIKQVDNDLLTFVLEELKGQLFTENTTKLEVVKEVFKGVTETSILAVYNTLKNNSFVYQLVDISSSNLLSGLRAIEEKFHNKIIEIANTKQYLIIADFCQEFAKTENIQIVENQLNVNVDDLEQWTDDKWQTWQFKEKYIIKLHTGKIPLKSTFLGETIDEYKRDNKFHILGSNTFIINEEVIDDLHVWLKDEEYLTDEEYNALFTKQLKADETVISKAEYEEYQRLKQKTKNDKSKQKSKDYKNNYNDRFYEIAEILNPGISENQRIGANLEAKIAILQWLEEKNDIKKIEEHINLKLGNYSYIHNVEFRFNNEPKKIIAKSARKSNLKINPNEWLSLADNDTILIIWFGGNDFKQINEQNTLIEENPNTLIRIDKQDATIEQMTNLASNNQYLSTFKFVFYSPANISDEVSNMNATNEDIDIDFNDNYLDNLDL